MEPLITTELEHAILLMAYEPTLEWARKAPAREVDVVAQEREAGVREARRVLDVLYDVDREFKHVELGLDLGT